MKPNNWTTAALFLEAAALFAIPLSFTRVAEAHDMMHEGHNPSSHATPAPASLSESTSVRLSNKPLTDQDGHTLRLKDDVIGDHIVVLTFVYINCTTVCPVVTAILSDLQNKLGSRFGTDVRLVSLTVDPTHDTPSRLKSYSALYGAKPGWFWLTGSSANVTETLKGFDAYTPNFENHPVVVMVGDGKTGKWSRHYGLLNSEHLLSTVNDYLEARNKAVSANATDLPSIREPQSKAAMNLALVPGF